MKAFALALILLYPATVHAQEEPKMRRLQYGLLIVSGGLAGADLAVSMDAFARGTATEANPVLRPLVNRPILFGAAKRAIRIPVLNHRLSGNRGAACARLTQTRSDPVA